MLHASVSAIPNAAAKPCVESGVPAHVWSARLDTDPCAGSRRLRQIGPRQQARRLTGLALEGGGYESTWDGRLTGRTPQLTIPGAAAVYGTTAVRSLAAAR